MVDLHLHTNASDGRCTPAELVARAAEAGLSVISVTDHDTFAATEEASAHAAARGLRLITGIEITAMWRGLDVHVLAYYVDPAHPKVTSLIDTQRADRVRRVHVILDRLASLGLPVQYEDVVVPVGGRVPHAIGRPQVARAMVRAGHVDNLADAFDRYLGEGQAAFVPRSAPAPSEIVGVIVASGGIASLAHPGQLGRDEIIGDLVDAGMQAIEVYHPDHSAGAVQHYLALSRRFDLAVTGGSDYHAEGSHGGDLPGLMTLPMADLARLDALAARAVRQSGRV